MNAVYAVPVLRLPSEAEIRLPGSKSHANRAIVCAALAAGRTVLRGVTASDDVEVMVENLCTLGFRARWHDKTCGELQIDGGVPASSGRGVLDCHNAGTTLRFLTSVAALTPGEWTLTGDAHMQKRPVGDLMSALRSLGATATESAGCPPVQIRGGSLRGGAVTLKADQSSQYLTSLLLIAPLLSEGLSVTIDGTLTSAGYIDLTTKVMKDFGVQVSRKSNTFIVHKAAYRAQATYEVEGDWSAAGSWLILNELTKGRISMPNLSSDSFQSDRKLPEAVTVLRKAGDLTFDCGHIPDQVMNLCVLAAFRKGTAVFTGIANLRKKECDRLAVISSELRKAGIDIRERGDDLVIRGAGSVGKIAAGAKDVILDPHDDHRMAMAFAVLGLVRGHLSIRNPKCVRKSYPDFFRDLETVLRSGRTVSIVGMRGVGKSSMGRRLAAKLGMEHRDSDHLFEDAHGSIREYVKKHGWEAFRQKEEEVIASAVTPGIVLSLGGGALGSAKTRRLIREKTVAVWLQAKESELIKRLQSGKRPPLTDLPLHEEVRKFLLERGPHYREVAKVTVSPTVRFREQIPFVLRSLPESVRPSSPRPR